MKQFITTILMATLCITLFSQSPAAINYQAVARDADGGILANEQISVRFSIKEGGTAGSTVFSETHNVVTNDFGLFNVLIGQGSLISGDFNDITWGQSTFFLKVEVDAGNGFQDMGTTQFVSVPYALYAKESGSGGGGTYQAGSGISISGNTITNTGDTNPSDDITSGQSAGGDLSGTYPNPSVSGLQGRSVSSAAPSSGQVLKWNGSTWAPANDNAGGGSIWSQSGNDIYYDQGNVGIGISNPIVPFQVVSNQAVVLGDDTSGSGIRWMFIPSKRAVRSGRLTSTCADCWEADSIGTHSFSHGINTVALGSSSTVFGEDSRTENFASFAAGKDVRVTGEYSTGFGGTVHINGTASFGAGLFGKVLGDGAVAIGYSDTANGEGSVSMGFYSSSIGTSAISFGSEAKARGNHAIAIGDESIADQPAAIAIGSDATAFANGSVAIGPLSRTYGNNSVAIGLNPRTYGFGSFAGGVGSISSGYVSYAFGEFDSATADYSIAMGQYSKAFGEGAIAMGRLAKATGNESVAMGRESIASGSRSVAFSGSEAMGNYSFSAGMSTRAEEVGSVTFGSGTVAEAIGSMSIGLGTITRNEGGLSIGQWNIGMSGNLFEVGNGLNLSNRRTVFSVDENGNIGINEENPAYEIDINGSLATININGLQIRNNGNDNLGLDGDLVPYDNPIFDIGNNVAGEHWDDVVANDYVTFSDMETKENVNPSPYGLNEIMQLNPVTYRYKKEIEASQDPKIGLVAQNVEQIIPSLVKRYDTDINEETGELEEYEVEILGLKYMELIPVLIKGMQEQQQIIEDQNIRIAELEQKVKMMEK